MLDFNCIHTSFCTKLEGLRLDIALSKALNISRNQALSCIKNSLVLVNKKIKKQNYKVSNKDEITLLKANKKEELRLDNLQEEIEILYENDDFLVINKPSNLASHGAKSLKEPSLVDYLRYKNFKLSNLSGEERYGIVHRLDKDTSGAMLIAKSNAFHQSFSDILKQRSLLQESVEVEKSIKIEENIKTEELAKNIERKDNLQVEKNLKYDIGRIYICVISPPLKQDLQIDAFMGRNPQNRLKMSILDKSKYTKARRSRSYFKKIALSKDGKKELIAVKLYTGRTHQIRVHLASINRYIYGDMLYTPSTLSKGYKTRMLLHAYALYLNMPEFKGKFYAKNQKDLIEFLKAYFDNYELRLQEVVDSLL